MKFLRRHRREAELDAEIRSHLDEAIRDRTSRSAFPPSGDVQFVHLLNSGRDSEEVL
jgi:hypothetical protein